MSHNIAYIFWRKFGVSWIYLAFYRLCSCFLLNRIQKGSWHTWISQGSSDFLGSLGLFKSTTKQETVNSKVFRDRFILFSLQFLRLSSSQLGHCYPLKRQKGNILFRSNLHTIVRGFDLKNTCTCLCICDLLLIWLFFCWILNAKELCS